MLAAKGSKYGCLKLMVGRYRILVQNSWDCRISNQFVRTKYELNFTYLYSMRKFDFRL